MAMGKARRLWTRAQVLALAAPQPGRPSDPAVTSET
jgi:hypothetical protein